MLGIEPKFHATLGMRPTPLRRQFELIVAGADFLHLGFVLPDLFLANPIRLKVCTNTKTTSPSHTSTFTAYQPTHLLSSHTKSNTSRTVRYPVTIRVDLVCFIVLVFPSCHQSSSYAVLVLFGSSNHSCNKNLLIVISAEL